MRAGGGAGEFDIECGVSEVRELEAAPATALVVADVVLMRGTEGVGCWNTACG